MKRFIALLLLLALLPMVPVCAAAASPFPETLAMKPGEQVTFKLPAKGYWESDAPEIADAADTVLTAHEAGSAIVAYVTLKGDEYLIEVTVTDSTMPAMIQNAIDIALGEWEENLGKAFASDKPNRYTIWYCGNTPKCYFGWCGGFVNYCMLTAGVPMDEPKDSKPHSGGVPYSVFAAGVGKIYTGFEKMKRLTDVPQPGYLVIYGKRDYYAYIHIGLVTDVVDRGDGVYQIFTVEGNVSNRIKRYSYLYDTNAKHERNMKEVPEADREDPKTFQYTPHDKNWYVNIFCQTWQ